MGLKGDDGRHDDNFGHKVEDDDEPEDRPFGSRSYYGWLEEEPAAETNEIELGWGSYVALAGVMAGLGAIMGYGIGDIYDFVSSYDSSKAFAEHFREFSDAGIFCAKIGAVIGCAYVGLEALVSRIKGAGE
jgi:hypothetical protein